MTGDTAQKASIHQATAMLATSKNVLFPGHNHLQTTSADDQIQASAQCHDIKMLLAPAMHEDVRSAV